MLKKGLVLEGGAMRGMFSCGVIDVMMENGISFDGVIGVSAGAVFGCNYKSAQPGRAIRYNTQFCRDSRYCSFRSLLKTGDLFGAEFCYHELPEKHDIFDTETFDSSPMEFYVVATDVNTGEAVYHKCENAGYNELEWMRASASMPLVSRVVSIDGYNMLDGGISDSIPLKYFEGIGYDRNIIVLTQPKEYTKGKNKALPIMKILLRKYPRLLQAMATRHEVYNETLKYIWGKQESGEILVICPDEKLPIGRIEKNPDVLKMVYELGRKKGEENIEKIKKFLEKSL